MSLLHLTSAALRRITAGLVVFFGLITLHYFYFDQLPQRYTSIISISPSKPIVPSTPIFAGTSTLQLNQTPSPTPTRTLRPAATSWAITPVPSKHWQSWKVSPVQFEQRERERVLTWREKNPSWRYELLSDSVSESFVNASYPSPPSNRSTFDADITRTFHALTDKITRADFLRYLILYAKGGVYSDIDTKALKPVAEWIPERHEGKVNVVIGIEIDEPDVMWVDWADNFCFCQSTLLSAPGHRIFEIVIEDIIGKLNSTAKDQNTGIGNVTLSFQDVLRTTGPVAFTDAVFTYLSETTGTEVGRGNFSGINVPKQMADVLVLPPVAFVPGQPHSQSGTPEDEAALVQHMGMGSWRDAHAFDDKGNKNETSEDGKTEEGKHEGEKKGG